MSKIVQFTMNGMFAHDDDLFMYELDMEAAVEHWNLAMANGLDAVWANNSYELNIYYNEGNTNRQAAGYLVKEAIENIIADPASTDPSSPLTIDVQGLEWASYLFQVRNKQLPIFWLGWAPDYADPDNYVVPSVKSTGTFPIRIGLEGSFGEGDVVWDHATVDGWIDDAAVETDAATRITLYGQVQEAIVDHCAFLWGYQATSFHVERAEMNGYVFNPMTQAYFFHYHKDAVETTTTDTTTTDTATATTDTATTTTNTATSVNGGQLDIMFLVASGGGIVLILTIGAVFFTKRRRG